MTAAIRLWALTCVLLMFGALPAAATSVAYSEDPLRLVPFRESGSGVYSQGEDRWEVWVCDVPGWSVPLDPTALATQFNQEISPYFSWLSGGQYTPVFEAGGFVSSDDTLPDGSGAVPERLIGCEQAVRSASATGPEGVLIVPDGGYEWGYGTEGIVCTPPLTDCDYTYPGNTRLAVVSAGSVTQVPPLSEARTMVLAHEIGHAIGWGHSFGGNVLWPNGFVNEYDNVVDVMSGNAAPALPIGTHAYNRYAAGWIETSEVAFYEGGTHTYRLEPIGGQGYELVVIPLAEGYTFTAGLRELVAWDAPLAKGGVDTYLVDSRASACVREPYWPEGQPCWGPWTRISPGPPPASLTDTSHVIGVGEMRSLGSWELSVLRHENRTYLRITDGQFVGRFVDDDGNIHETAIEAISAVGITQGCDPPFQDRYCPSDLVSRAAMAAFMIRSIGASVEGWAYRGYFADVPQDAWYAPHVELLFELGVTTGYADGTYRPGRGITRAEMAVLLARAFSLPLNAASAVQFEDVPEGSWFAPHVGALFDSGVTKGCGVSPSLYCPNEPVPRDQMGSFLARILGLTP